MRAGRPWRAVRVAVLALLLAAATASCTPIPAPDDRIAPEAGLALGDEAADLLWDPATAPPPLRPGERAPDATLLTPTGQELSLASLRGRAVVLTFFETPGPDPVPCSELLDRLERLQAALPPGLRDRLHLLAITVDPARDTPSRLAEETRRRGADPSLWTLATADELTVRRLASAFHVARWQRDDGTVGHTLTTIVLDPEGRLTTRFPGTAAWDEADLLAAAAAAARR